jgi:hypothetical protein
MTYSGSLKKQVEQLHREAAMTGSVKLVVWDNRTAPSRIATATLLNARSTVTRNVVNTRAAIVTRAYFFPHKRFAAATSARRTAAHDLPRMVPNGARAEL